LPKESALDARKSLYSGNRSIHKASKKRSAFPRISERALLQLRRFGRRLLCELRGDSLDGLPATECPLSRLQETIRKSEYSLVKNFSLAVKIQIVPILFYVAA
jgi:hypothetical protein